MNAPARPLGPARRLFRLVVMTAVVGAVVLGACGLVLQQRLVGQLHRIPDAYAGLADRPPRPTGAAAGALNLLVATSDRAPDPVRRGGVPAPRWAAGARHVDSVLLLHLDADRRGATLVSLPVRYLAHIGSPTTLVRAVERGTGVRIDRLAVLDWAFAPALTRQDGGVEIADGRPGTPAAGRRHHYAPDDLVGFLDADEPLPGVRLDATTREQYLLRAVLDRALRQELRRQPWLLYGVLDTLSRHLTVDAAWSTGDLRSLVWSMRSMRSYEIRYARPVGADRALWSAVRGDELRAWRDDHPEQVLPWATG